MVGWLYLYNGSWIAWVVVLGFIVTVSASFDGGFVPSVVKSRVSVSVQNCDSFPWWHGLPPLVVEVIGGMPCLFVEVKPSAVSGEGSGANFISNRYTVTLNTQFHHHFLRRTNDAFFA